MAITVTTGRKLKINKNPRASNVIPGFGYALMDMFENEFVAYHLRTAHANRHEISQTLFGFE